MNIQSVFEDAFAPYGRIVQEFDCASILDCLHTQTEKPTDGVQYVPSYPPLENLPVFSVLQNSLYGGMPIQVGYCNGSNTKLNCVEYHRDSEINIPADDIVLLLGKQCDIKERTLDTSTVRAFYVPAGTAVELYATTLHYAPCDGVLGAGFRVAVVLPKGTNTPPPSLSAPLRKEDALLWACNKWLLAHAQSAEATLGAYVGLIGANIDLTSFI